jgi:hypothetical protein
LTPTQLTLRHLRQEGWPLVEVVERWIPGANIRRDLFGFIDVIAVHENGSVLAVQTTSSGHVADRIRKITDHPNLPHVRQAGWLIHVHGWRKKNNRWTLREVDVS